MSLVQNERAKLTATYFNGLAIALFAVGGLAPLFAIIYGQTAQPMWIVLMVSSVCFLVSAAIHWTGRWMLRTLRS